MFIQRFNKLSQKAPNHQPRKKPTNTSKKKADRMRYAKSKKMKLLENFKQKILNFSSIELIEDQILLLGKGFGFVPTPEADKLKTQEWLSAIQHIRREEWRDIFYERDQESNGLNINEEIEVLPEKLKIIRYNRPNSDLCSPEIKEYANGITGGFHNFSSWASLTSCNMSSSSRKGLNNLIKSCNKEIMICQSDKDGKLIICDMIDYKKIVLENLRKNFTEVEKPVKKESEHLKNTIQTGVIDLHKGGLISDKALLGTIGFKLKEEKYLSVPNLSSNFNYNLEEQTAYCYPLFKTHKKNEFQKIQEIPIRLVTATSPLPTTKLSALLEHVLHEHMVNYCETEYCRDSKNYLKDLTAFGWYKKERPMVVCVDVRAMYPTACREMTVEAVRECLYFGGVEDDMVDVFCNLTKLTLTSVLIEFDSKYYKAESGILTGACNSVSIANCLMRYTTRRVDMNKLGVFWRRFIDDGIAIFEDGSDWEIFIGDLRSKFAEFGFELEVRPMGEGENVEFLDVNHVIGKLETSLFVKPTAKSSTFLHPSSYHPDHTPKGTLTSESIRIRRICSTPRKFEESMKVIYEKARRSGFSNKIIEQNWEKVKSWDDNKRREFLEVKQRKNNEKQEQTAVWPTSLPHIVKEKFQHLDKFLPTNIKKITTYKRPPRLRDLLFKPKKVCSTGEGNSTGCGSCLLCGGRKSEGVKMKNMVMNTNTVTDKKGKKWDLKLEKDLCCRDNGIYHVKCKNCSEVYIGQTCTSFRERFNGHRSVWRNALANNAEQKNEEHMSLFDHYAEKHQGILKNLKNKVNGGFDEAFEITFVDRVGGRFTLLEKEDFWTKRVGAKMNKNMIITPTEGC